MSKQEELLTLTSTFSQYARLYLVLKEENFRNYTEC